MTSTARTLAPITIKRPEPPTEGAEVEAAAAKLTPEEQLQAFEASTGARLSTEQRQRFIDAQIYKGGDLAQLHDSGTITMRPEGTRVLLRAILQQDASILSLAGDVAGHAVEYDARTCIAHEIVAIGHGVAKHLDDKGIPKDTRDGFSEHTEGAEPFARPAVGDHVFVLSTVADRASKTSRAVRLWTVNVDDVSLRWPKT